MFIRTADIASLFAASLSVLLIALVALPFAAAEEIIAASLLSLLLIVLTEVPLLLVIRRHLVAVTLGLRLLAVLIRMVAALGCAAILAPHYTGAFILIFSLSLALSIMASAFMMCSISQEPAHD
jgi:hypothetical protein